MPKVVWIVGAVHQSTDIGIFLDVQRLFIPADVYRVTFSEIRGPTDRTC